MIKNKKPWRRSFLRQGVDSPYIRCRHFITSIFFTLWIDGRARYFHGYCDLADITSGRRMREAIVERETRPVRAMTRQERLEHIWSSTHDDYRGYAGERWPAPDRGKRTITVYGGRHGTTSKLLDGLTDQEIS